MKFETFFISFLFSLFSPLQTLDIFVASSLEPSGTGSQSSPYNSFLKAVREVSNLPISQQTGELNILLTTNLVHFFEAELISLNFPQIGGKYELFSNFSRFEEVRIMPYACYQDFVANISAENCAYFTVFSLKSNNFTFTVGTSLRVHNVIFQGNDLNLQYNPKTDSICWFSLEGCCKDAYLSPNPYDSRCDLTATYRVSRSSAFVKYSLFSTGFSGNPVQILINRCVFKNFNEIQKNFGYSSLFSALSGAEQAKLLIISSEFTRSYLRDGLFETAIATTLSNVTISSYNFFGFYESSTKKSLFTVTNFSVELDDCAILNVSAFMKASNCEISLKNTRIRGQSDSIKLTNSQKAFLFELNNVNFVGNQLEIAEFAIERESSSNIRSFFGVSGKILATFWDFAFVSNDLENNLFFSFASSTNLQFSMTNSRFSKNSARTGGVLLISGARENSGFVNFSNFTVTDTVFCEGSSLISSLPQDLSMENVTIARISLVQEGQCSSKQLFSLTGNVSAKLSTFQQISFTSRLFTFTISEGISIVFANCSFLNISGLENGLFYIYSVAISQGSFLVNDSYFLEITALQNTIFEAMAVYKTTTLLSVYRSIFSNISTVLSDSPGCTFSYLKSLDFLVSDSIFSRISGNHTAICTQNSTNFSIFNSFFVKIQALSQPGLLYMSGSSALFENSHFDDVTSVDSFAGAIYFENTRAVFQDFSCKNVRVGSLWQPAGAFYAYYDNRLSFSSSVFSDNYNLFDQGGLLFAHNYNNLSFSSCVFLNNSAYNDKGGTFSLDSYNQFRVENSHFLYFSAQIGAGIYAEYSNFLEILSTNFANFSSLKEGAGVYLELQNTISLTNASFSQGNSRLRGAALYFAQNNVISVKLSSFFENSCEVSGGAIALGRNNEFLLENGSFSTNFAVVFGGALFASQNNSVSLENSEFLSNSANNEGGTLSFEENNAVLLRNCVFRASFATNAGTLRVLQYNRLFLEEITAISCESLANSGFFLIYFFNSLEIHRSSFENLRSGGSGSFGFLSYSNEANFFEISLTNCSSLSSGGLIYASEANSLTFSRFSATNASSAGQSGGLFYLRSKNAVKFSDFSAENVQTFYSGAFIWAFYFNEIALERANFRNFATVQENAGLIFADHRNYVLINASLFENVSAKSSGGAFYLYSQNLLVILNATMTNVTNFKDFAAFLYLESQNNVTISQALIENLQSGSGKSVFLYAEADNVCEMTGISLVSRENAAVLFENYVLSVKNNAIALKNASFRVNYTRILFELANSAFVLENANFTQKLSCGVFAVFSLCQVSLQNVKLLHFFDSALFSLQNSAFSLRNFVISPQIRNKSATNAEVSLLLATNCTISLKKGTINLENSAVSSKFLATDGLRSLNLSQIAYFSHKSRSSFTNFALVDVGTIFIEKCLFFGAKTLDSGSMFSLFSNISSDLRIKSSVFLANSAKSQAGAIVFASSGAVPCKLVIENSNFLINAAFQGGVAAIFNVSQTFVRNSRFSLNRAHNFPRKSSESAKAGVFLCISQENAANVTISQSEFSRNRAQIGGSLFHAGKVALSLTNASFFANFAEFYGQNLASEVQAISFITDLAETLRTILLRNVATGAIFEAGARFSVAGLDQHGNIAVKGGDLRAKMLTISAISLENSSVSSNSLQFSEENTGLFPLTGPFQRLSFPLPGSFPYRLEFLAENSRVSSTLSLFLSFRSCVLGERLLENFTCAECEPGYYSFNRDFAEFSAPCTICSDWQVFNCFGGSRLTPKRDYWRISSQSSNFVKCAKDACLGDPRQFLDNPPQFAYFENYATGLCAAGYKGILCDECAEGYGKVNENTCVACGSGAYGLSLITQLLLRVVFTLFSVNSAMTMSVSITKKLSKDAVSAAVASNILKVFINHVQILALALSLPFHWPERLSYSLSIAFSLSPSVSESLNLDCILQTFSVETSSLYYKVVAAVLYPFCILCICLLERVIRHFLRKSRKKPVENASESEKVDKNPAFPLSWYSFSLLMIVFLLCYCDVVQVILQLVEHQNYGDERNPDYRVVRDKSIEYFSESHQHLLRVYAVPLVVFLGIACPVAIFAYLLRKRVKKLMSQRFVLFSFGFYYYTFKENYFFWDILTLMRKISVFFVKMYFFSSTANKSLYPLNIIQAIILLSLMLQINFKPYQAPEYDMINGFETNSLITLYISYYFATFYMFKRLSSGNDFENSQDFYVYAGICGLFPAFANILFVFKFLTLYYKHNIQKKVIKTLEIASSGLKKIKTFVKSATKKSIESPRSAKNYSESPVSAKRPSEFGLLKKIEISSFREVVEKFEESKEIRLVFDKKASSGNENRPSQTKNKRNARFYKELAEFYLKNFKKISDWREICDKNYEFSQVLSNTSEENNEISEFFKKKAAKAQQSGHSAEKDEVKHEFLEENFEFFNCVLAKTGTFLKTEQFSIDFSINYLTLHGTLFVKLSLSFQAKDAISSFEFSTETEPLDSNELLLIPQHKNTDPSSKTSKTYKEIELFVHAATYNIVPSFGIVSLTIKSKKLKIKFRLPITLNLFLTPVNKAAEILEFPDLTAIRACETLVEKRFNDPQVILDKIQGFFTFCQRVSPQEISGTVSWLNDSSVSVDYSVKIVGGEQILIELKGNQCESLLEILGKFIRKLIQEYDVVL